MKFKQMAEQWMASKNWSDRTRNVNQCLFDSYIYPVFAERELHEITVADVRDFMLSIESKSTDLSHRINSKLTAIFDRALVFEHCEINPARPVQAILKPHKSIGFDYVKPDNMSAHCQKLESFTKPRYESDIVAIWLLVYTAQRLGEIQYLQWSEVDFARSLLCIPAERMKSSREHLVPLPHQLLSMLILHHSKRRSETWLFPMRRAPDRPIWKQSTRRVMKMAGCEIVNHHGYRKTFSTHASESGLWSVDAIESQLAHQIAGVRGVYNKAQFLPERRKMMQWYADEVDRWRGVC